MKCVPRRRTCWITCNAAGMMAYLYLASTLWVLPGEEGQPGGPGDAFYWILVLVPILAVFMLVNLTALAFVALRRRGRQRVAALAIWSAVGLLWVGTVVVDQARSVRYIDAQYA